MANVKEEISKNLLFYRKRAGLTQKQLADQLGVKHNAISAWENGTNSIDIETLVHACDILHVTINDMYGIFGDNKASPASEEPEAGEVIEGPMSKEFDLFYKFLLSRGFNSDHLTDLQRSILASVADILDAVFPSSGANENDRSGMSG